MSNQTVNKALNRDSNMELLRIVSMSMIVIYHFLVHGVFRDNSDAVEFRVLYPFVACGVNLFFLLSGFFQIRLSTKGVLKLVILVMMLRFFDLAMHVIGGVQ